MRGRRFVVGVATAALMVSVVPGWASASANAEAGGGATGSGETTRTTYGAAGQVTRTTDQNGHDTTYTYLANGLLDTTATTRTAAGAPITTSYAYDRNGNLTTTTRPDGKDETQTYDQANRVIEHDSAADPDNPAVRMYFEYNTLGQTTRQYEPTTLARVNGAVPDSVDHTDLSYYPSGDIKSSTDPWNLLTSYEYDEFGNQTQRTFTGAGGDAFRGQSWTYHPDGSLASRSDAPAPTVTMVDNEDDTDPPGGPDNDNTLTTTGTWTAVPRTAGDNTVGHRYLTGSGTSTVTWTLTPAESGTYTLQASCPKTGTGTASYTVSGVTGSKTLDQSQCGPSQRWYPITNSAVSLTIDQQVTVKLSAASGTVMADAVRAKKTGSAPTKSYQYAYDADGNQTSLVDNTDQTGLDAPIKAIATSYDQLGRATSVQEYPNPTMTGTATRTTTYRYDLDGNTRTMTATRPQQVVDGTVTADAVNRTTTYRYDARNLMASLTATIGASGDAASNRTWRYAYDARGLVTSMTKPGNDPTHDGNITTYAYYLDGLLKKSTESDGNSDNPVTSHLLTYTPNGDTLTDASVDRNADNGTELQQTSTYSYYPNRQLKAVDHTGGSSKAKRAKDEAYQYDAAGNLTTQVIGSTNLTDSGPTITTTKSTYDRQRLITSVTSNKLTASTPDVTTRFHYDPYGRTSTVYAAGAAITGSPRLISRYTYDGFDRIAGQYGYDLNTQQATTQTTTFDPLDRPTSRTSNGTETRFRYLGLSKQVDTEQKQNTSQVWTNTKSYTYAPNGKPLALVTKNADGTNPQTRYYSLNPHGDTEALTDPATGSTKATYRYTAFGDPDPRGTTGDDKPDANDQPDKDPLNPLQYQAQRVNGPYGDYDTGFRTYDPGLNRFLSRDMYTGALDDFNLGTDPWNTNRYTFSGDNPITNVDLTGHMYTACDRSTNACAQVNPSSPALTNAESGGGRIQTCACQRTGSTPGLGNPIDFSFGVIHQITSIAHDTAPIGPLGQVNHLITGQAQNLESKLENKFGVDSDSWGYFVGQVSVEGVALSAAPEADVGILGARAGSRLAAGATTDSAARAAAQAANDGGWLSARLAMRNERGAISFGSRFNDDQQALIQLAKDAKRRGGLSMDEGDTLATWADELGLPGHAPAVHPGRPGFGGTTIHINIGPIKHIPVLP